MEKIKIVDFDPDFLNIFDKYKKAIRKIIPELKPELIGSAAVPMKGKEEIDIMIVADNFKEVQEKLSQHGFDKGPVEGKTAYLRDYRVGVEAEFHIVQAGSKKIEIARRLVSILRNNPQLKEAFEKLKEECNGMEREEYKKRKSGFITRILENKK